MVHKYTEGANLYEAAEARRDGPKEPLMMEDPPGCIEEGFHGPNASHWGSDECEPGHRTVGVEDLLHAHMGLRSRTARWASEESSTQSSRRARLARGEGRIGETVAAPLFLWRRPDVEPKCHE